MCLQKLAMQWWLLLLQLCKALPTHALLCCCNPAAYRALQGPLWCILSLTHMLPSLDLVCHQGSCMQRCSLTQLLHVMQDEV
jgi:hypothetical protein